MASESLPISDLPLRVVKDFTARMIFASGRLVIFFRPP
jgi:hypothetical protein